MPIMSVAKRKALKAAGIEATRFLVFAKDALERDKKAETYYATREMGKSGRCWRPRKRL